MTHTPDLTFSDAVTAIRDMLDLDSWNHALDIERVEVESMKHFAAQWDASISGLTSKKEETQP